MSIQYDPNSPVGDISFAANVYSAGDGFWKGVKFGKAKCDIK